MLCLIGFDVVGHGLNLHVHVCVVSVVSTLFSECSHVHVAVELSWQVMRTWEETQTESESK